MSKLKQQLKVILPSLSEDANKEQDREIKRRYYLIKAVVISSKSVVKACALHGISTDYFYVWAKRLVKQRSLSALRALSKKPKYSPNRTRRRIEKRIVAMRRAEPYLGADRLSFELKRLFNMACAPSTVNAVLHRFNLITKETKKRLTKKHIKRYRRNLPGYCQIDVKYVPQLVDGKRLYEFNFVDHCTTWRFIRIYPSLDHLCVADYLAKLKASCPFPIFEIQTDNGAEFTDKYRGGRLTPSGEHVLDQWCKENNIGHRLIPVGQKELNGKVENTHKQDDREFFSQHHFKSLAHTRILSASYNERWNRLRYTKALGRRTPEMALENACVRVIAWVSLIKEKYQQKKYEIIKWDEQLNASLPTTKTNSAEKKPKQRPSPRKRKTFVNRYLQYQEWSRKKSS